MDVLTRPLVCQSRPRGQRLPAPYIRKKEIYQSEGQVHVAEKVAATVVGVRVRGVRVVHVK